jgi:hypothetical protein
MHAMLTDGMTGLIDTIDTDTEEEKSDLDNASNNVSSDKGGDSRLLKPESESNRTNEGTATYLKESYGRGKSIRAKDLVLFADSEIRMIDPSTFYELKHENKVGEGGFAKVFKARRHSDGLICALKFCEPQNESERNLVINEIGLMN